MKLEFEKIAFGHTEPKRKADMPRVPWLLIKSSIQPNILPKTFCNQGCIYPSRKCQHESEESAARQELMASHEERADLKAKIYLLEKELAGLRMVMIDKDCMEEVLR